MIAGNFIGTDPTGKVALGNRQNGVTIIGSNNTIGGTADGAGNVISGNGEQGIFILALPAVESNSNQVQGNYIGTTADGTMPLGNGLSGINLLSSNNTIGGTNDLNADGTIRVRRGNIISGNTTEGVTITGSTNVVQGNYIGTDVTGTTALANLINGVDIVSNGDGAGGNSIGGTNDLNADGTIRVQRGNVISGNRGIGVRIGSRNNVVQGNYIGTNSTGNTLPGGNNNAVGVLMDSGADFSTIGGTADGARNVISSNLGNGVDIRGSNTVVQGNYIGTDATGKNLVFNSGNGVLIIPGADGSAEDASNNTIGGTANGARNVISGNLENGVNIRGSNNVVQGNYIGTDANGQTALGNFGNGVRILSGTGSGEIASNNTIGGTNDLNADGTIRVRRGNVISGNQVNGVSILGLKTVVQGNLIGTDSTGQTALGNQSNGVFILPGADRSMIGGTEDGAQRHLGQPRRRRNEQCQ